MRRPVALMFGLSLIVIVKVHCYENIEPVVNRMNDLSDEVSQVKMNLAQVEVKVINQIDLAKISLGIELKQNMKQHVRDAMVETLKGESIEEMVRSLTVSDVKQLKRGHNQVKRRLYHVMKSLRDVQKERDVYKEALEKAENQSPELKCILYTEGTGTDTKVSNSFINSPLQLMQSVSNLTLELQSIKMEQGMLNMSVSATREDLMSTRSEMKMVQASDNVTNEDVFSMKSELTQVQDLLRDAGQDILSTQSVMKMVQASLNVTGKEVLSMKPELAQVQALLNVARQDISSLKSEITAVNTSLRLVRKEQRITISRLSAMDKRIVQVQNATNTVGHKCPDGFHQHGDSCYWFSTFTETFMSARTICEHMRSHLAIITSEAEDNFIKEWALQHGKAVYYWLGGSDLGLEGHWKWEGGRPMVYTNWHPGGPDNWGGQQACLIIDKRSYYQWNDASCDAKANIICEA